MSEGVEVGRRQSHIARNTLTGQSQKQVAIIGGKVTGGWESPDYSIVWVTQSNEHNVDPLKVVGLLHHQVGQDHVEVAVLLVSARVRRVEEVQGGRRCVRRRCAARGQLQRRGRLAGGVGLGVLRVVGVSQLQLLQNLRYSENVAE